MRLHFAVSACLLLCSIPAIVGQSADQSQECSNIRDKLQKNMALLETASQTAQMIQQKDCNSAKNSVKLTKKYGKCLPAEGQEGMSNVFRNMRFVSRIICDNVNKRIGGCFSTENLKQFNQCHNKTLQYMDFIAKQNKPAADGDKPQTRRKRFLLQDLFSGIQGRASDAMGGGLGGGLGGLPGLSGLQDTIGGFASGFTGRSAKKGSAQYTSFEHQCCKLHLQSDCFLNKVLNTCAEKSELRLAKAFQTVFSFALRDVVDIACGRIESLDQCEKFSNDFDVEADLGF